jgi:hypothetical protein
MDTVEDEAGNRYVLLKRSSDAWLVRDPVTGETEYRDPSTLTVDESADSLATAAAGVPPTVRTLLTAVPNERVLGLVATVVDTEAVAVRTLLDQTTLCESDLHGAVAELVAAGLLAETTVAGERGYEATELAIEAIEHLRTD